MKYPVALNDIERIKNYKAIYKGNKTYADSNNQHINNDTDKRFIR